MTYLEKLFSFFIGCIFSSVAWFYGFTLITLSATGVIFIAFLIINVMLGITIDENIFLSIIYTICGITISYIFHAPVLLAGRRLYPFRFGQKSNNKFHSKIFIGMLISISAVAVIMNDNTPFIYMIIFASAIIYYVFYADQMIWKGTPNGRFAIFLRRFDKTGDRAVFPVILKKLPPDMTLVLIVGSGGSTWDPFPIITEIKNVIFLSKSEDWEQHIKLLIESASVIILDYSDVSEAIDSEVSFIVETEGLGKTIFLYDKKNKSKEAIPDQALHSVPYKKGIYSTNLLRMVIGFVLLVIIPQYLYTKISGSPVPGLIPTVILVLIWGWLFLRRYMDPWSSKSLELHIQRILASQ
ncbi:MAG: hypothetical protein ABW098_09990 [Candidatus Thiodiazotropha sp.]